MRVECANNELEMEHFPHARSPDGAAATPPQLRNSVRPLHPGDAAHTATGCPHFCPPWNPPSAARGAQHHPAVCHANGRSQSQQQPPLCRWWVLQESPEQKVHLPAWLYHQQVKISLICSIPLCFQDFGTKSQQHKSSCWQSPCRLLWAPELFLAVTAEGILWSSGKLAGAPFRWLF